MIRRGITAGTTALLCTLLTIAQIPEFRSVISADAANGDLPIIDAHDHLQRSIPAEDLIKLMDLAGVSRMVLMALVWNPERGSDSQALDYARRYPGRFLPFIAFQTPGSGVRSHWLEMDSWALARLSDVEGKLRGGGFYGMGEILLRHYDYSIPQLGITGGDGEVDIPADSPLMLRIADLASKYHVPMLIHAEGEPLVRAAMERLIKSHPDARVIWAHNCGRQSAAEIGRLLAAYSNLYCDLASMEDPLNGYGSGWPRSGPWTFLVLDAAKNVLPEMKAVFEEFPDRFLGVGADKAHNGSWQWFVGQIGLFRQLLSQLSPAAAQKMAHENAERLFALPPTTVK